MGAYENIGPLDFNTSSAGAAWANAAAQAGAMFGKAIEERSKLDLLELEKDNKKALDVLKSQQAAASRIQQKTEELQSSKEFKGLDVRLQEKVIEDHKRLFDLETKRDLCFNY
jgi:5-enolpyruvylshikimate-3-phosphate synthase